MRPTHFTVGSTIYWTIHTYSQDGELTDADSNPAVEVSKNGVATIDAVSVVKRGNNGSQGTYRCQYTPSGAVEGDTYTFEETATIGTYPYVNGWALVANAPERGTDNASTFDPATDAVANVTLVDTTTNLTNSGSGGSSPADIYAYFVDGNRDDAFKADVTNLANETTQGQLETNQEGILTILNSIVLPNQATIATRTLSIETVTNKLDTALQQDGSDYQFTADALELAPTGSGGGGGDTAATIYTYFTSSNREDAFQADVSGLSTFDASSDQVVASNMRGTDGANTVTPNTVAPDNASISAILNDTNELQANQGDWATATTVVASNMRGTDNALLASDAPTNWSDMLINGDGKVTTSNPAAGAGSSHTAQDVANLILETPANKLATDSNGDVTANNMRGTDGANTVTPVDVSGAIAALNDFDPATDPVSRVVLVDTTTDLTNQASGGTNPADIYNYFTDGSREDAFKADTAGLSTYDPASDLVTTDSASRNASKADVSGLASQSSVDAVESKVDTLVTDSSGWGTADVSGLATQASVNAIDSNVDTLIANQGDWATADVSGLAQESSVDDLESDVTEIKNVIATTVIPNQVTQNALLAGVDDVTSKLDSTLQQDGSNYQFTVDALALAPTGSGGGGGSGDSAATIYNYFTTNSREDAFKADVSGLATSSEVSLITVPSEGDIYSYFTSGSRENVFKADISGLSTIDSTDVNIQVIAALNSYDAAKGSEVTSSKNEIVADIAGLNDFDPASDTVANVTTVQNVVNGGGGGGGGDATAANQNTIIAAISSLNDFDPNNDVVANVTTVQNVIHGGGGSGGGGGGTVTVKATPTPRAF